MESIMNFLTRIVTGGGGGSAPIVTAVPRQEIYDHSHSVAQIGEDNTAVPSNNQTPAGETIVQMPTTTTTTTTTPQQQRPMSDPQQQERLLNKLKLIESEILKEEQPLAMMRRMLLLWSSVSVRNHKMVENNPLDLPELTQKARTLLALADINETYYSEEFHILFQLAVNDTSGMQSLLYTSRYMLAPNTIGTQTASAQQFLAAVSNELRLSALRPILYKPLIMSSYLTFPLIAPSRQPLKRPMWWLSAKGRAFFSQVENYSSMLTEPSIKGALIEFRLEPLLPFEEIKKNVTGMTIMSCSLQFLYLSQWEQLGPIKITLSYDDDDDTSTGWDDDFDLPNNNNITSAFVQSSTGIKKKDFEWQSVVCSPCGEPLVLANIIRERAQRRAAAIKKRAMKQAVLSSEEQDDEEDEEEEEADDDDDDDLDPPTPLDLPLKFYDPVSNNKQSRWLLTEPRSPFDPDVPGHVYVERNELWVLFVVPRATTFGQYARQSGLSVIIKQNMTVLVALMAIHGALVRLQGPPWYAAEATAKLRIALHQVSNNQSTCLICTN